jgi:TolA-binding protein
VVCGKANCCCAAGEPHIALYLTQSKHGKTQQLYVPKQLEERVRQAIEDYQELQRLVEELSEQEWKLLKQRKD